MTKIALAVACLVGSTAAFAVGVTPADIEAARLAGTLQQAWISGATAPTKSIYEGFVGATGGCDAGSNSILTTQAAANVNTTPGSLGNFTAYACTRSGVVSVLYHTLDGGSLNYVTPHTIGTKLARVAFPFAAGVSRCAAPTTYTDTTNANNNAALYKSCAQAGASLVLSGGVQTATNNTANATAIAADPLAPQLPVGGFSDVEAGLFAADIGGGNVSSFGTQSAAGVTQVFGVAVSVPAYRAMQAAQGVSAGAITADTTFDPAIAPSISSAQYASIVASGGAYASGTGWQSLVGAAGTGKRMNLQRRVATSGTQASSNAFFLKNPCSSGVAGALNPQGATNTASLLVVENSGSGNVKTGITTATNALATSISNFAIGVLSLENDWRLEAAGGGSDGYRFIKVDGVHPEAGDTSNARLTGASGDYRFVKELVNFVRNDSAGVKTAFEAAVVGQITTALANPVAATCGTFPRGLGLVPKTTNTCTVGIQVFKGTANGNNCSPQTLLF